ncbi:MAG: calcium/sodium antiporter [Eubacteriales bacterium]
MLKDILFLLLGFTLLIKGSEFMIDSASKIANKFKIPAFIIGFSIIAFGTSAPELTIGIITGITKTNSITLGAVLGSAVANIALVIGVAAILATIKIEKAVIRKEIPLSVLTMVLLMLLLFLGGTLSRTDGIIMLGCFLLFLFYIFARSKNSVYVHEENIVKYDINNPKKASIFQLAVILFLSMASIALGGNFVVQSSTGIARTFGISEFVIGVTIVAIGTSLPELFTTIAAINKNKADIAIGNVIGSNIFNILLVLGTSASIHTIPWENGIQWDFFFAFGATILMLLLSVRKRQIKKYFGIFLLAYYIIYILFKTFTGIAS